MLLVGTPTRNTKPSQGKASESDMALCRQTDKRRRDANNPDADIRQYLAQTSLGMRSDRTLGSRRHQYDAKFEM
jgi:hypothetical protein